MMPAVSADPLLDIVMLVHDKADWADLAIAAVERFTKNPYKLTIVDNASVELDTSRLFDRVRARGHRVIHLPVNKSFSNGVNIGVAAGSAKYIAILNDDAIVTEGWDGAIMTDCTPKNIGMVGARSNAVAGAQGDPSFIGEPPYLCFVCVCLRRDVWNAVGQLDEETFDGFSTEDIDYSWRVKKAGFHLKVSSAYVLHAGSRTLISSGLDLGQNNSKYNARLMDKWGKEFAIENAKLQKRGLVTTYHAEEWTRVEFMKSLMGLRRSDGIGFEYLNVTRAPIHLARQLAADFATDGGFDWWVQLDDDATFPNDVLRQLLAPNLDVVCAIAYQRKVPYNICVFEMEPGGILGMPMKDIEHTGIRKVDASGFHCSVIKTSVIKKLREAGIKQYFGGFDNKLGEDFAFCMNLKKVGVQMYCNTDLISGHIGSAVIVDEAFKRDWLARQPR